jgi:hypothetical protein
MDMNEGSAMTEGSGLVGRPGPPHCLRTTPGKGKQTVFSRAAPHLAEQLRKRTIDAPLRSLLVAFLFGAWVASRR